MVTVTKPARRSKPFARGSAKRDESIRTRRRIGYVGLTAVLDAALGEHNLGAFADAGGSVGGIPVNGQTLITMFPRRTEEGKSAPGDIVRAARSPDVAGLGGGDLRVPDDERLSSSDAGECSEDSSEQSGLGEHVV